MRIVFPETLPKNYASSGFPRASMAHTMYATPTTASGAWKNNFTPRGELPRGPLLPLAGMASSSRAPPSR
jgi:hypothetical protein